MFLLSLLAVSGCVKDNFDTTVIIRPRVIQTQGSTTEGEPAYMARVYAVYIDKNELDNTWTVASYADADAGIFTNTRTGERRVYGFMGEQADYGQDHTDEDTYISLVLSRPYVAFVAVDQMNRFYAYRTREINKPLPRLYMTVRFVLWKPDVSFRDSEWTVVNGDLQDAQKNDNTDDGG